MREGGDRGEGGGPFKIGPPSIPRLSFHTFLFWDDGRSVSEERKGRKQEGDVETRGGENLN